MLVLIFGFTGSACRCSQKQTAKASTSVSSIAVAPHKKNVQSRRARKDSSANFKLRYAKRFKVSLAKAYTKIEVMLPWRKNETPLTYFLYPRGAIPPSVPKYAIAIPIPVRRVVTLSTTYLGFLDELQLTDKVIAVDHFQYVNSPKVLKRIQDKTLNEVGSGPTVNVERLLALAPDLVFAFGRGVPESDAHPALERAGLKTVLAAEFYEATPLARAEWIKFIALFFNRVAEAERIFAKVEKAYLKLCEVARQAKRRPTVLLNADYRGSWYIPGGRSYKAAILRDAGAAYLWEHDSSSESKPIAAENVLQKGAQAEFWLYPGQVKTLDELLAIDQRYRFFEAVKRCRVYNNNARLSVRGGNDFWEHGPAKPHLVLTDLIRIFHPQLMRSHKLYWHRHLGCLTRR